MSIILVTHNLGIVAGFCDRVQVMYAGTILESAKTRELFNHTAHPYTKALIRSVPSLHSQADSLYMIPGPQPDLSQQIKGCPFAPRCEYAQNDCISEAMVLTEINQDHFTSCIRIKKGELSL
jgi:oligopeptide/dipeptide ABC transporter ATP-binding protein